MFSIFSSRGVRPSAAVAAAASAPAPAMFLETLEGRQMLSSSPGGRGGPPPVTPPVMPPPPPVQVEGHHRGPDAHGRNDGAGGHDVNDVDPAGHDANDDNGVDPPIVPITTPLTTLRLK